MEINHLFGAASDAQNTPENENEANLQFTVNNACACPDLNVQPLIYALQKNLVKYDFNLHLADGKTCAKKLIQGEVELALIPSVEYAKGKGAWQIVPEVCLAFPHEAGSMALFFNKDLHTLRRVAVDERYPTAVALLQIILREKYELEPELVSVQADLPAMLQQADAALLSGDRALQAQTEFPAHLDLGEEWYDLTGLPFVAAIWAGHEISLTETEVGVLKQSAEIGQRNLEKISKEFAVSHAQDFEFYKHYLQNRIRYTLGPAEREALSEFFHYAFYLGLIEHIPELHFWGEAEEKK